VNAPQPGVHLAFMEQMLEENIGRIYGGRVPDTEGGYRWIDAPVVEQREMVNHPRHYNAHPSGVECIEIMEHMTCNLGNAFKYGWRYQEKGDPVENLKKMLWYLKRAEEHDTPHLFTEHHALFFRKEVMHPRLRVFQRPSPWAEPVRVALAALCDMHAGADIVERVQLTDKIRKCIGTAIDDLMADAA
jgi:hypothetical protein